MPQLHVGKVFEKCRRIEVEFLSQIFKTIIMFIA